MDYFLKQGIDFVCIKKDEKYLKLITEEIINKINTTVNYPVAITYDELHPFVLDVYHMVSYADIFPKDTVNEMYSLILNKIEDAYFKLTKKEIKDELCEELEFTKKKKQTIMTSYKLKKVDELIKKREYDKLDISKKELLLMIKDKRKSILDIKDVIKNKIIIKEDNFNYFEERFIQGTLNEDEISKLLNCDKKVGIKILKKYNEVLLELSNKIDIDKVKLNKLLYQRRHKVGFDYNNFIIVNDNDNLYYVNEIINSLPDSLKAKIIANSKTYEEITFLIPFLEF